MRTIWKYQLETTDEQFVEMPQDAELLCVQVQHGVPCLWAHVDTEKPIMRRLIRIVGTGHDICFTGHTYVGSYQLLDGDFIGHVLDCGERGPAA